MATSHSAWRRPAAALLLAGVTATAVSGCSVIHAVHAVVSANHALSKLTSQLQASENAKFEVTYETTGSSPSTVTYAADPPSDFADIAPATSTGGASELIENASGVYSCSSQSSGSFQCLKISAAQKADYAEAFQIYTGAYWYAILDAYSTMAALTGVKIDQTSKTVNGYQLSCLVITDTSGQSTGGNNTGTYCVTQQGVLGYVAASGSSSVFEIKSYTSPPPASAFQLPAGATITTMPAGTTGAGSSTSSTASPVSSVAGSTGATGGSGSTGQPG